MYDKVEDLTFRGTTTIGVAARDGVILASDTRVTMGSMVAHKRGKKVYRIDDRLAMTISGNVADAQRTVEILKANARIYRLENKRPMPVKTAGRLVANLFFSARLTPYIAQILVGGVDDSGPHIYALDPFGSLTEEKCVATGSGSPIAYGVLEDKYKEDLPMSEALLIVVNSVASAMKRNVATGDSFDVAVIDEKGYRELTEEEKKAF
ncbi:MAG: archaeal proteasome endopeptidase complex subunit beta [Candidatus Bathyarchaeota archaeon]|nr:archaeal proteasome endopeptidase complex subunit beta [Candidatus Bathyarchaeota archaeon]